MSIRIKRHLFTLVAALLFLTFLFGFARRHGEVARAQAMISVLQAEESSLADDNLRLQSEIDNASDEDLIRSIARSELGLVDPGEKVFYDTSSQHN